MSKLHQTRWDERTGATANARRELPHLAASYFAQVRALLADDPSPASCTASGFSPSACATRSSCFVRATVPASKRVWPPCAAFNSRWEK